MKRPTPKVEKLAFVPFVENPNVLGILGTAVVRIDGMGLGPLIVMRQLDARVHTSYVVPFEKVEIPACLHEPDVRTQIEALVAQAMKDWEAKL